MLNKDFLKKLVSKELFWIFIIVIIAAFFRFYNLGNSPPGLYPDEAMNGNNALEALSMGGFSAFGGPVSGWKVFYPENTGREGLFINIQAISIAIFGNHPWALRLVSGIFGTLTVLGVYFLTKELFGRSALFEKNVSEPLWAWSRGETESHRGESQAATESLDERDRGFSKIKPSAIALLSALLLATSFWHINFSRIGFRAIMAPFFLTWALYFLLRTFREIKENNSKSFIKTSIIAGIFYGLGFHSYIAYRATPFIILILWLFYWFNNKEKEIRKKFLISCLWFGILTIIVFLPLGIYFVKNPADFFGRTSQISIFSSATPIKDLGLNILKTLGMFNVSGDWNWRHNIAGRPELFWPVGIMFLIGIVIGIKSVFKNLNFKVQILNQFQNPKSKNNFLTSGFGFWILFSWLVVAALPVVISNESLPHALRSLLMAPPAIILAAVGIFWLYQKLILFIDKKTINVFAAIFIGLLIYEAYNSYFIVWAKNQNTYDAFSGNYVEIGNLLNSLPSIPKYVVVEAGGLDVRGIPMPAQTVMFITDTFTPEKQKAKNIHYVLPISSNFSKTGAYIVVLK